jgi:hypothetical protein
LKPHRKDSSFTAFGCLIGVCFLDFIFASVQFKSEQRAKQIGVTIPQHASTGGQGDQVKLGAARIELNSCASGGFLGEQRSREGDANGSASKTNDSSVNVIISVVVVKDRKANSICGVFFAVYFAF